MMADKCCWCGKALVARDIEAFRGTNEEPLQTVVFECPDHRADWERPPEGLVPALVAAVRAGTETCRAMQMIDTPDCEDCAAKEECEMATALALLDRPGEEARDA